MIKFGTDGWRGIISEDFTFSNVAKASQGLADYILSKPDLPRKIAIGYDRRFFSEEFAREAALVFAANGIRVLIAKDYMPTPVLSWSARNIPGLSGAVVITASHNPPLYNGFKYKENLGCSSFPQTTEGIEKAIEKNEHGKRSSNKLKNLDEGIKDGLIEYFEPFESYCKALLKFTDRSLLKKIPGSILIDPMNGAGAGRLSAIFKTLNIKTVEINSQRDPYFRGINPEPIAKNIGETLKIFKREKCFAGLILDGDSDRLAAIDENGEFLGTQELYSLVAWYFLEKRKRREGIAKTVSTTHLIDRLGKKYGVKVHTTPIGFKHIAKMMVDKEVFLGGEESGGMGLSDHLPERDALLISLVALNMIAEEGSGLRSIYNKICRDLGEACFVRDDFHINSSLRDKINETMREKTPTSIGGRKIENFSDLDGFKFVFPDGSWLLIRTSGTEAVLRLYAESKTRDDSLTLINDARQLIGI
jgi:phosphomannomutase